MAAPKGTRPPGGSRKGVANKISADVRAMILAALEQAGGEDHLLAQATANPRAFLGLLGRLIPTQVAGPADKDLIPESATDPGRLAQALLAAFKTLPGAQTSDRLADAPSDTGGSLG